MSPGLKAARETVWLKGILDSICGSEIQWPIQLCGDNQGALALAKNHLSHHRTKHIDIRHRFITELVSRKIITVAYIHLTHAG